MRLAGLEPEAGTLGEERVCMGEVVGAHGVKGLVRVRSFTEEPEAIAAYGALQDERGRRLTLEVVGRAKGLVLARIEGVADRTQAEALKGTRLYLERAALPAIEEAETYYHADLIGLSAEDGEGRRLGRVTAVHDFGAGDLLQVEPEPPAGGGAAEGLLVPFTRAAVPAIDLEAGRIVVLPQMAQDARQPEDAEGTSHEP